MMAPRLTQRALQQSKVFWFFFSKKNCFLTLLCRHTPLADQAGTRHDPGKHHEHAHNRRNPARGDSVVIVLPTCRRFWNHAITMHGPIRRVTPFRSPRAVANKESASFCKKKQNLVKIGFPRTRGPRDDAVCPINSFRNAPLLIHTHPFRSITGAAMH